MTGETRDSVADTETTATPGASQPAQERGIPVNSARRIAHIDAMRAGAVLLVVAEHSGLTFVPGDGGVTVFFCISGYIITTLLLREQQRTGGFALGGFYARRFLKLAPPFLLIVLIPTVIYAFAKPVNWGSVISQIFFTYNWAEVLEPVRSTAVLPGSTIVWSLAVEEQFYIVFAILWIGLVRKTWWRKALITTSVAAIVYSVGLRCFLATDEARFEHVARGTDARMEAIAWGVLIAVLYFDWRRGALPWIRVLGHDVWPFAAAALFVVGSLVLRAYWPQWALRPTLQALAAALVIMYGLVGGDSPVKRAFYRLVELDLVQVIGLASYSIYLSHLVLMKAATSILETWALPVRVTVGAVVTVAIGIGLYYLIEVPMLQFKRRMVIGNQSR